MTTPSSGHAGDRPPTRDGSCRSLARRAGFRTVLAGLSVSVALLVGVPLHAASPTPELQKAIRASTFEVVMKKPEKDPLSYEKPLPLDLLPYIERTDAFRSVGTAFALGHNRYVTAAHVLLAGVDSQFGAPALRQADGSVFEIDQIQKFSAYQDFVLFSLKKDPGPPGFEVNEFPQLDDPVMAVGNALGEGIVIRDGLYTSATAEEQDGRWKWIRFSAAASPGNSGGPLLDAVGRVMGIVIGKSPNENLNYSLPITQLLQAPDHKARFEQRTLIGLPYLQGTQTYRFNDAFDLPLAWSAFATAYQAVMQKHEQASRAELLKTYAPTLFPKGPGTESVLYAPDASAFRPRLIAQQPDKSWTALSPDYTSTDLSGDGSVAVASVDGVALLRLVRPDNAVDDAFYRDSRAFMDLALKGLNLRRTVGNDPVRITSLGPALSESVYVDHYGRSWQERVWAVPFLDVYMDVWLLPTPDGYSGFVQYAPSSGRQMASDRSRLLVDLFDVSYRGTVAQWRAFLARKTSLPRALADVTLGTAKPPSLRTKRFEFKVPPDLLTVNDQSVLTMTMGFFPEGTQTLWDIQEVWWNRDAQYNAALGLVRRLQPPKTARLELRTAFEDMRTRHAAYSGDPDRESASTWRLSRVLDVPNEQPGLIAADLLYAVVLRTDGAPNFAAKPPLQVQIAATTQILEKGLGAGIVPGQTPVAASGTAGADASSTFDRLPESILKESERLDGQFGKDPRGRIYTEDLRDLLASAKQQVTASGVDADQANSRLLEQLKMLAAYWMSVPALMNNRDLWASFLSRNHLPATMAHAPEVVAAEQALRDTLSGGAPTDAWAKASRSLAAAYIGERRTAVRAFNQSEAAYTPRLSACPSPATSTSGTDKPKFGAVTRTPDEFYPDESRHRNLEGAVVLSVHVSPTGCADRLAIAGSSGAESLDEAAKRYAETMEFLPAAQGGKAVDAALVFKVVFKLND